MHELKRWGQYNRAYKIEGRPTLFGPELYERWSAHVPLQDGVIEQQSAIQEGACMHNSAGSIARNFVNHAKWFFW